MDMYNDAKRIYEAAIRSALPDAAVQRALTGRSFGPGRLVLIAIGKAAWQMASAARDALYREISHGVVITKYGHSKGPVGALEIFEAAHPVPDENSFIATQSALEATSGLSEEDTVLFLISGGGSALFEKPIIPPDELESVTAQLLSCGADITEVNTVRKRLSAVKGGKFALHCAPARVLSIILSDVLGDPPDMIASGPAYPDSATSAEALAIADKYSLSLSDRARRCLAVETPKALSNVETVITGSVRQLCESAKHTCIELGYAPTVLTTALSCQARQAGAMFVELAVMCSNQGPAAFIAGGETVVNVTGSGLGGRNQELALSCATGIAGLTGTAVFSIGSDGTDGPTDAAGGYVDWETADTLAALGVDIDAALDNNDSYHALEACGGLIKTGPTGTNVNDLSVLLIGKKEF